MRITLLDIKGFGLFDQVRITPDKGFNIIYESNESGKSTLQAFIRAMLYGQKGGRKGRDGSLPPLKQYKPWNAGQYAGVMEYMLENGDSFRVGRNFDKGTVNIYDKGANNVTSMFPQEKDAGPKFAEEHLGLDEATFERSACIRQLHCAVDENGRKSLIEKLSNLNTAGNEELSLTRAVNGLESAIYERVGTGRTTTRPLDKVNIRLSELEQKKRELRDLNDRYLDTALALHEKKSLLGGLISRHDNLKGKKNSLRTARLRELSKELADISAETEDIDREIAACTKLINDLKDFDNVTDETLSKALMLLHDSDRTEKAVLSEKSEYGKLQDKNRELTSELDSEEVFRERIGRVEESLKNYEPGLRIIGSSGNIGAGGRAGAEKRGPRGGSGGRRIVASLGLLLTLLLTVLYFLDGYAVFIAGAGLSLVISILLYLSGGRSAEAPADKAGINQYEDKLLERALADGGFHDMSDYLEYKEAQLKGRGMLEQNCKSLSETQEEIIKLESGLDSIRSEIRDIIHTAGIKCSDEKAALDILKQGADKIKRAKEDKRILLARKSAIEERKGAVLREAGNTAGVPILSVSDLKRILPEPSANEDPDEGSAKGSTEDSDEGPGRGLGGDSGALTGQKLDAELVELGNSINSIKQEIVALNTRLEQAPSAEELTSVTEEIAYYEEKKQNLEKTGAGLSLAIELLNDAALKIQRDYIPALNNEMSNFVSRLTSGRYNMVRTNDDMQIVLESPGTEELVSVSRLSGGTIDQVYFSMRLAALSLLEKGRETIPLFLDEPFSQYDENRVKSAFELLKELSAERQIFFFTCRQREYELARSVFGDDVNRITL